MLAGLQLVSSSRYLILAIDRFNHGFQIKHLPFDEPVQNLVRVLHFCVEVVKSFLQMPLLFIFEKNELICFLLLCQADVWQIIRGETTSLNVFFPLLLKDFDVVGEDIALILIKILVEVLIAAPFVIEALFLFDDLVFEIL